MRVRLADGHQEDRAFASGVWGEEIDHIIIEESQPGGAETQRVRCEIDLAADDACLQLNGAIPAVAQTFENAAEIREEKYICAGVGREILFESKMIGLR